jgi:hypothetical protein
VPTGIASGWVIYEGRSGPGKGKHIVVVASDQEYRCEESMPQLANILAVQHRFRATVLLPLNRAI